MIENRIPTTYLDAALMLDSARDYLCNSSEHTDFPVLIEAIAILDEAINRVEAELFAERDSYAR
jgi:hypothetical protein